MLHSLQEADDMDFALEEEMMPEIGDVNEGYVHDHVPVESPAGIAWDTAPVSADDDLEVCLELFMTCF